MGFGEPKKPKAKLGVPATEELTSRRVPVYKLRSERPDTGESLDILVYSFPGKTPGKGETIITKGNEVRRQNFSFERSPARSQLEWLQKNCIPFSLSAMKGEWTGEKDNLGFRLDFMNVDVPTFEGRFEARGPVCKRSGSVFHNSQKKFRKVSKRSKTSSLPSTPEE